MAHVSSAELVVPCLVIGSPLFFSEASELHPSCLFCRHVELLRVDRVHNAPYGRCLIVVLVVVGWVRKNLRETACPPKLFELSFRVNFLYFFVDLVEEELLPLIPQADSGAGLVLLQIHLLHLLLVAQELALYLHVLNESKGSVVLQALWPHHLLLLARTLLVDRLI